MKKHLVQIPLLILLLFACSQHPSENNRPNLSAIYARHDTLGYNQAISNDHRHVRRQIDSSLNEYLGVVSRSDASTRNAVGEETIWLVSLYTRESGITDKDRCLNLYQSWGPHQASVKVSLDSAFSSADSVYRLRRASEPVRAAALYDSTLRELQQSYISIGDSAGVASVLFYRANAFYNNGRIDEADNVLSRCAVISRDLGLHERLAYCNLLSAKIASVHRGDPFTSERLLLEARDCFATIGRRDQIPYVLIQRAYNLLQESEPEKAIHLLNEAVEGYRQFDRDLDEGFCLYLIGECYCDMQQHDSAWEYARRLWQTRNKAFRKYRGAGGYLKQRLYSDIAHSLSLMGLIRHAQGRFEPAAERFDRANEIFEMYPDTSDICLNRGRLAWLRYDLGDFLQARDLFKQNLLHSSRFEDWFDAVFGMAVCEYRLGRSSDAGKLAKLAVSQLESVRSDVPMYEMKKGVLAGKVRAYDLAATIHINEYLQSGGIAYLDSCLFYTELVKARTLRSMLNDRSWSAYTDTERRLIESRSDILADLVAASADTLAESTAIWDRIESVSDSLYRLRLSETSMSADSESESTDAHSLRPAAVSAGAAVMSYQLSPFGCFAVVFTSGRTHVSEIGISYDSLRSLVQSYRAEISCPPDIAALGNGPSVAAQTLCQHLVPKRITQDSAISQLIVVPSDVLYSLPLETLVGSDGRYLAERYSVAYAMSLGSLSVSSNRGRPARSRRRIVAFGDPALDGAGGFERLNYSLNEVASIENVFGQANASTFVGRAATEANFKTFEFSSVDFVHIASHGFCDFSDPANSAILFSPPGSGQSVGLLHPDEARYLNMPVDAVFLSTCQSGAGRMLPGEGLMGLARPFLLAGAGSVIVTMWNVDDRSSATFVKEFYSRICEGQSAAASLQAARRKLLDAEVPLYKHPYFWGPYIVMSSH